MLDGGASNGRDAGVTHSRGAYYHGGVTAEPRANNNKTVIAYIIYIMMFVHAAAREG